MAGPGEDVLLLDVSWSTGKDPPDGLVPAREFGLDKSWFRTVLFGRVPVTVPPGERFSEADVRRAGREGSDLAAGLRASVELAGPGGRVFVATDGRVDVAGAAREARGALDRGVALFLRGTGVPRDDPRIVGLRAPERAGAGAAIPAIATVGGPPGSVLELEFRVDGRPAARRSLAVPASGLGSMRVELEAPGPGWHEVGVALTGTTRIAGVDSASTGLVVAGAPRARVVNAPELAAELRERGWDAEAGSAAEPLFDLDLLVLRDVPATDLPGAGAAVRDHVEGGGGLLVLGGPRAFGPGGYGGRPLEECLPVRSDPVREGLLVIVLLDSSGTMREPFAGGSGPKSEVARSCAARLLAFLPDDAAFLPVPFTAAPLPEVAPIALGVTGGRERAERAVAALPAARGGTALVPPLRLAGREAGRPGRRALVILVTDGRLEGEKPEEVLDAADILRGAGARLEVLSVGADADRAFLARLAGSAARVAEPGSAGELERAFLDSLLAVEGEGRVVVGPLPSRRGSGGGPTGPGELPPVQRLVRTWAREGAEVSWFAGEDLPLVAHARRGLGRSAAVTTDPFGPWAPGWSRTGLAADLAEFVRRPAAFSGPRVEVRREGPDVLVAASVRTAVPALTGRIERPSGESVSFVLHPTGTARFEGRVRTGIAGAARITLDGDGVRFEGGASIPGNPEYGGSGPDAARLAALAEAFGGPPAPRRRSRDASVLLALGGIVLLLGDRVLKLRAPRRR